MRVVDTFTPRSIATPRPDVHVVDMGRTVAGWVRLHARGRAGARVTIRYGERLRADGTINNDQTSIDAPIQTDTYVMAGRGEEVWEPRFSYKGFRFVELTGLPAAPALSDIEGRVVRSSPASIGSLRTSDRLLNRIHRATRVSLASNLHGIPTDTPVYEKNGWLDDMDLLAETTMLNFDAARFLTKWIADIGDAQAPSGLVPVLAPSAGYGYGYGDEWGSESVILPWLMYQWYGDRQVLTDSYRMMKAHVDFEARRWRSGIARSFIGDWNPPGSARPPERSWITATAYYYLAADLLAKTAKVIGRPAAAAKYARLRDRIRKAFIERFFDPGTNTFATPTPAGYRQTSNAIALSFGLVPEDRREAVAAKLAADVRSPSRGHLNTGMFGTKELLPALSDSGYGAEALAITQKPTYPSWGYWFAHGADSLWENWELTARSRNHFMFGTVDNWFFTRLAGLQPSRPGFETFTVRPGLFGDLKEVRASTDTVRGRITVHRRAGPGGRLQLDLTVPGNSTATVHLPARSVSAITESGTPLAKPRAFVSPRPRTARPSCQSIPAATGSTSQDGGKPAPASVAGGGRRRPSRGSGRCHRRWGRRPGCRGGAGRGRPGGRSA
jgi:alpha-L-rhamnosidase